MQIEVSEWLDRYQITRKIILGISMWMLYDASRWSQVYASGSNLSGTEIASILAMGQAPATLFAAWAFKVYVESKA